MEEACPAYKVGRGTCSYPDENVGTGTREILISESFVRKSAEAIVPIGNGLQ